MLHHYPVWGGKSRDTTIHDKAVTRVSFNRHAALVKCTPPGTIVEDDPGQEVLDFFDRLPLS
jgi:hypothetical protein